MTRKTSARSGLMNGKDKITKMNNMEIKVGDKVRVREGVPRIYLRGFDHIFTGVESVVSEVES